MKMVCFFGKRIAFLPSPMVARNDWASNSRPFLEARRVIAEYWRRPPEQDLPDNLPIFSSPEAAERRELYFKSLERCWARLSAKDQGFLLRYCVESPPVKLSTARNQLAEEMGATINMLRVMAHRLKRRLRLCIEGLMK